MCDVSSKQSGCAWTLGACATAELCCACQPQQGDLAGAAAACCLCTVLPELVVWRAVGLPDLYVLHSCVERGV